MEAVLMTMNSTGNNNNRIRYPKQDFGPNRTLFPYPSDDLSYLATRHFSGVGLSSSIYLPPVNLHHFHQQPPLLPLPISVPLKPQNINIARSNSVSVSNNNIRLKKSSKNHPKKPKNKKTDLRKPVSELSVINKTIEPKNVKDVSKDVVSRVFSSSINNKSCDDDVLSADEFSGSVMFTRSPPPSSLPLPTFSLRSKGSCKAEASVVASGVDSGATDGLRRLLRL